MPGSSPRNRLEVFVSRSARAESRALIGWWKEHRSAAKFEVRDVVSEAYEQLAQLPYRGAERAPGQCAANTAQQD